MGRSLVLAIFALLVAGCSLLPSGRTAFADLEPDEKELIVPDTADWAGGEICGDSFGDCDGPEDFESIEGTYWMKAAGVLEAEHFPQSSDLVLLRAETPGLRDQASDEMGMSLRGGG